MTKKAAKIINKSVRKEDVSQYLRTSKVTMNQGLLDTVALVENSGEINVNIIADID